MWYPDPQEVKKFHAYGTGDMATVTDDLPSPSFGLKVPFVLAYLCAWFESGSGTSPTMYLKQKLIAHQPSGLFDKVRRRFPKAGTGDNDFVDFRPSHKELYRWGWSAGDLLVPEWTNPDSGTMTWTLEVGLAPTPGV